MHLPLCTPQQDHVADSIVLFEVIPNISRAMTQADKWLQGLVGESPTVPDKIQFSDVRSAYRICP